MIITNFNINIINTSKSKSNLRYFIVKKTPNLFLENSK